MNKIIPFLLFLLLSCNSETKINEEENTTELIGEVFTFVHVSDTNGSNNSEHFYPEFIYFYNSTNFIFTYHEEYEHYFSSGKYETNENKIILQFNKLRYHVVHPEIPAISAVDTTEYAPDVVQSPEIRNTLFITIAPQPSEIYLQYSGIKVLGIKDPKLTRKEFSEGLWLQGMDFMLQKK